MNKYTRMRTPKENKVTTLRENEGMPPNQK